MTVPVLFAYLLGLGWGELVVMAVLIVLLFSKRLPAALRGLGAGCHAFVSSLKSPAVAGKEVN